ncbi:MAG TPA: hypothetical protein VHU40_04915, partial [Polyangia bacterium]|nr:hypothetical protein [Polyangia bacterium]
ARAVAASPVDDDAFSLPAAAPRASEGGDLFGMAPMATQADSGRVRSRASNGSSGATLSSRHDGGRVENLTAQRSENSVLFSLSNLQSLAAPSVSTKPSSPQNTEGSGLIDIRAMAASTLKGPSFSAGPSLFGGESKVAADELPTFGAFSSAAPVLFPIPSSSGPPKWLFLLIGVAALLVLVVGFLAFKILSKPMIAETVQIPVPVAVAPPAPAAPASKPIAEGDLPPREKPEAAGADKGSDKADKGGDKVSKGSRHGGSAKGSKKGSGGDAKGEGSGSSSAAAPSAPAEPEKAKPAKGSLDDLLEGALNGRKPRRNDDDAPAAKEKKGGGDSGGGSKGPLEKSAVVAGMNGVKGKVQGCFNQFKVPGMAMVNVVISPSGKVSSATVTGKFAGTPTGSCVEGAVKTASFPPSEGLSTPYPFNLR